MRVEVSIIAEVRLKLSTVAPMARSMLNSRLGIVDVGDIFQHTAAAGQHSGRNNGNGGIFGTAGGNFSVEPAPRR